MSLKRTRDQLKAKDNRNRKFPSADWFTLIELLYCIGLNIKHYNVYSFMF